MDPLNTYMYNTAWFKDVFSLIHPPWIHVDVLDVSVPTDSVLSETTVNCVYVFIAWLLPLHHSGGRGTKLHSVLGPYCFLLFI